MDTPTKSNGANGRRQVRTTSLLRPTAVGFDAGELSDIASDAPNGAAVNGLGIHLTPASAAAGGVGGDRATLGGALSPSAALQPLQRRRGHHHKHSLSHQFFLPPANRAPISLPAAHPVPTWREVASSATTDQKIQFAWSLVHLVISFAVWRANEASLAAVAISKCVAFDAFGLLYGACTAAVDNFACWRSSSVERPFGVRRLEVVAMFGMAVYLLYTAVELSREVIERLVIGGGHAHGVGDHVHLDPHSLTSPATTPAMLVTLAVTAFAQIAFGNHAQLASLLAVDLPWLPVPFALLSIVPSLAVLASVFLFGDDEHAHLHAIEDRALAGALAGALAFVGIKLIYRVGSILLVTYPVDAVDTLYEQIERDEAVDCAAGQRHHHTSPLLGGGRYRSSFSPDAAALYDSAGRASSVGSSGGGSSSAELDAAPVTGQVWQCWSDLVVVALRVRIRGGEDVEQAFRSRCHRYVRDILAGGYGSGNGLKLHVTVECVRS